MRVCAGLAQEVRSALHAADDDGRCCGSRTNAGGGK